MNKQHIELQLSDNNIVLVEISEKEDGKISRIGRENKAIEKARYSLENVLSVLNPICESIHNEINDVKHRPDEAVVEFGLKFSLTGKAVIAEINSEASLKISLTWRK